MSLPSLLIIDTVCPKPYDPDHLLGTGGTEQTVVKISEGLSPEFKVWVEQHNRTELTQAQATYSGPNQCVDARWVICLRNPLAMVQARERFPNAKIYLWSHDLADRNLGLYYSAGAFAEARCSANISVSKWHRNQSVELLKAFGYHGEFRSRFVYNPVEAEYTPSSFDPNKLVWIASPHKGLTRAYELLTHLVRLNHKFKFYVANPGYIEDLLPNEEIKNNVVFLGTLSNAEAISHLRNSLCLFYPNTVFPETFGKILAEANAVGTPVLTSPLGASREVLDSHPAQIIDCKNTEEVIKRVLAWSSGERPIVRGNPKFKLVNVLKDWKRLINDV